MRLKELREEKNMSQVQLANKLGVNNRTISQYERGIREPDIQTIKQLCAFFNVSAGYLLGMED